MYDARRILRDLADTDRRRAILKDFWRYADTGAKAMAIVQLAKALHFRDETIRKMPAEKKADLLASRIGAHEFDQVLEMALMQYHTHEQNGMMKAFLDLWGVPNENGSIEVDEYQVPSVDQIRDGVRQLEGQYDRRDIAIYLATAGLLMGEEWRGAWAVADELLEVGS